jgi:ABC-2 type transport system permease protein
MRTILFIFRKELIQIFRDKYMPRIIIGVPLLQLLVLAYAATFEIKTTRLVVSDQSRGQEAARLISRFGGSPFYTITHRLSDTREAEKIILRGEAHQILVIPSDFEMELVKGGKPSVQILTDAVDASAAGIRAGYAQAVIASYSKSVLLHMGGISKETSPVVIAGQYWYNPELNYQTYMIPGILVILVTILGMFLAGMNVVKEKEAGTIEQINVTPIRKYQFIAGKLLPFFFIAMLDLALGLALAKVVFNIPMVGSLGLVFLTASLYLSVVLSMGLIISAISDTQQQAMFIAWFFAIVFILLSGLFTPIESMPQWAQWFNKANPIAYFISAMRMILLKGSGFSDVFQILVTLAGYGLLMGFFAIRLYRKTT